MVNQAGRTRGRGATEGPKGEGESQRERRSTSRRSRLNSLGPGVYVGMNEHGQSSKELVLDADIETARKDIQEAFKDDQRPNRDRDRMTIIEKVLKDYFAKVQ